MLQHHSSNHHTVSLYGRLFFIVSSNSRAGLVHFVDLEPAEVMMNDGSTRIFQSACTCEAWVYGERPCRHIAACFEAIAAWAGIPADLQEEWIDRLMFLLNMGHSFEEALASDALLSMRPKAPEPKPEPPKRRVRNYTLKPYETTDAAKKDPKRRLPPRMRGHATRLPH